MRKAAFVYDEGLVARTVVEDAEFNPSRLKYTYELLRAYRAFNKSNSKLVVPEMAGEAALLSFHTRDYVEGVRCFSRGDRLSTCRQSPKNVYGRDPPGERLHARSGPDVVVTPPRKVGDPDHRFSAVEGRGMVLTGPLGLHIRPPDFHELNCPIPGSTMTLVRVLGPPFRARVDHLSGRRGRLAIYPRPP